MHALDRPVWASLSTHHAALSEGGALAKRYAPDVHLFASARDNGAEALAALAALVGPGEKAYILQVPGVALPRDLDVAMTALGVQMIATGPIPMLSACEDIVPLGEADMPEMLALATLTEPGPFAARTHTMGAFFGVRIEGRLAAMAGERMRLPGFTELSGVCTHPDFRGRGLARRLSATVARRIERRGEQPFLHAWKDNAPAIALYEQLGFRIRTEVNVVVLQRSPPAA